MKTNLKKLIQSTKRTLYVDDVVLATAPAKIEGELEFFTLGRYVSDDELQQEYDMRGLIPADIQTLIEHDSEVDEKKYVGTHWKNKDGKWCFVGFFRYDSGRYVSVRRFDDDWSDDWWFAGFRKSDLSTIVTPSSSETLTLEKAQEIVKQAGFKIFKEL